MLESMLLLVIFGGGKISNFLATYESRRKLKAFNERITQEQVLKKKAKGYIQDYIERRRQDFNY